MLPPYNCGQNPVHVGNVAHSIEGWGVIIQNPDETTGCSEFSYFSGYKIRRAVMHMALYTHINKSRNIVTIDSSVGLMAFGGWNGHVEVSDSVFYGGKNMPNKDCWKNTKCGNCIGKAGLYIPTFGSFQTNAKESPRYIDHLYEGKGGEGTSLMKDLKFIGFDYKTQECGGAQRAITTNGSEVNYHPLANYRRI